MRPGQLEPNELEMAILSSLAQREPALARHIQQLHVLSREFRLGAILFCRGDHPICLELYTYGDEYWDGVYDGYSIAPTPNQSLQPTAGHSDE